MGFFAAFIHCVEAEVVRIGGQLKAMITGTVPAGRHQPFRIERKK
jgi:hypothetical protein